MPTFNWEINVTSLIAIIGIIGFFWKFYYGTENSNKQFADALLKIDSNLDKAMTKIDKNIETSNKIMMDMALSNQRMDNTDKRNDDRFKHLEEDMREMKHGKGFIQA